MSDRPALREDLASKNNTKTSELKEPVEKNITILRRRIEAEMALVIQYTDEKKSQKIWWILQSSGREQRMRMRRPEQKAGNWETRHMPTSVVNLVDHNGR